MVFNDVETTLLHEIIGDVPGISMKGISKDVPWPGSRCGWIEVYNAEKDPDFKAFIEIVLLNKMLEVCSTTLPQIVLPHLYEHPEYPAYLQSRIDKYQRRADEACDFFKTIPQIRVNKPKGVFYLVAELLDCPRSTLESVNKEVRMNLDALEDLPATLNNHPDFQFDDGVFTETLEKIGRAVNAYYA